MKKSITIIGPIIVSIIVGFYFFNEGFNRSEHKYTQIVQSYQDSIQINKEIIEGQLRGFDSLKNMYELTQLNYTLSKINSKAKDTILEVQQKTQLQYIDKINRLSDNNIELLSKLNTYADSLDYYKGGYLALADERLILEAELKEMKSMLADTRSTLNSNKTLLRNLAKENAKSIKPIKKEYEFVGVRTTSRFGDTTRKRKGRND